MGQEDTTQEHSLWETESGLMDDFDGWITNPHFGVKDEYAQAVIATSGEGTVGLMFIFDLIDENGEVVASQGYSIGKGWEVSDDGLSISHPKRKNVVTNTMYGQLQIQVVKALGVNMDLRGAPTDAKSWDGLGFHWNLVAHATVSGEQKQGLMPTGVLEPMAAAEEEAPAAAPAPAPAKKAPGAKAAPKQETPGEAKARAIAEASESYKEFSMKVIKEPLVAADDELVGLCLDAGPNGFYETHKKK